MRVLFGLLSIAALFILFLVLDGFLDLLGYLSPLLRWDLLVAGGLALVVAERRWMLVSELPRHVDALRVVRGAHTRHLAELSLTMGSGDMRFIKLRQASAKEAACDCRGGRARRAWCWTQQWA